MILFPNFNIIDWLDRKKKTIAVAGASALLAATLTNKCSSPNCPEQINSQTEKNYFDSLNFKENSDSVIYINNSNFKGRTSSDSDFSQLEKISSNFEKDSTQKVKTSSNYNFFDSEITKNKEIYSDTINPVEIYGNIKKNSEKIIANKSEIIESEKDSILIYKDSKEIIYHDGNDLVRIENKGDTIDYESFPEIMDKPKTNKESLEDTSKNILPKKRNDDFYLPSCPQMSHKPSRYPEIFGDRTEKNFERYEIKICDALDERISDGISLKEATYVSNIAEKNNDLFLSREIYKAFGFYDKAREVYEKSLN